MPIGSVDWSRRHVRLRLAVLVGGALLLAVGCASGVARDEAAQPTASASATASSAPTSSTSQPTTTTTFPPTTTRPATTLPPTTTAPGAGLDRLVGQYGGHRASFSIDADGTALMSVSEGMRGPATTATMTLVSTGSTTADGTVVETKTILLPESGQSEIQVADELPVGTVVHIELAYPGVIVTGIPSWPPATFCTTANRIECGA